MGRWKMVKGGHQSIEDVNQDLQMRLAARMGRRPYPLHQIQFRLRRNACHMYIFNIRLLPTSRLESVVGQPESGPYWDSRTWEGGDQPWRAVGAQP